MILLKLKLIHRKILNLIFPKRCAGCKKLETYICSDCLNNIDLADRTEVTKGVVALFNYHDKVLKKLIWQLKYHGRREIAQILGRTAYAHLIEDLAERKMWNGRDEKILIIPVPLARSRERARGFNQAELLAKAFCDGDQQNFEILTDVLVKVKNTPTQVSLKNREARLKNLHGAFKVSRPEKIKDRDIILIDDVATTGATLTECRKTLRAAGAHSVLPLAIASG